MKLIYFIPDIPIKADSNATKTCEAIVRYTCGIANHMQEDEDVDAKEFWSRLSPERWPELIMKHTGPALWGDGSSIFAMLCLMFTTMVRYTFWAVFGGFHALLELHKNVATHLVRAIFARFPGGGGHRSNNLIG